MSTSSRISATAAATASRACPFGVIEVNHDDGRAWKCTLCYDRQKDGMEPACAKACPTQSIQFGEVEELQTRARERVGMLHARGVTDAYLYGADERTSVGPLNAFFLLVDRPEVYNLPERPHLPQATDWQTLSGDGADGAGLWRGGDADAARREAEMTMGRGLQGRGRGDDAAARWKSAASGARREAPMRAR